MKGPTDYVLSSTKWEHYKLIGSVAVNMKFSKSSLDKDSINAIQSLIKGYMLRDGFEIQINVTDQDLLEKARKKPATYRSKLN